MLNIEVNRVYKLQQNSRYVYCLYALPLPLLYGMVQNQECVGILISSPKEAVTIYELLSNDKLSYNEIIATLKDNYALVTFWSVEVTGAPKDQYYQFRTIQEANKKRLSEDEPLIHYSQAKLKVNNKSNNLSILKQDMTEQNNKDEGQSKTEEQNCQLYNNDPFEKEINTNNNCLEIKGCYIKIYNRIIEIKLNNSKYYVYSPMYILRQNSKKISDAVYIGILLKLSNKMLKKRTTNHMSSIMNKNNRDQLMKILNYYLSLDKVSLRSINRLFTFNTTLFKDQRKMRQGIIEEQSCNSQEIISKFASNIIEIIDYLPVYKQYQIVKNDKPILNINQQVNYNGVMIPNFFTLISQSKKNCYIKFKTGEIGFKLDLDGKDIVLKFIIPSIDKSFKTFSFYKMITVDVTKWYSINDIESYGKSDRQLANIISLRIQKLYAPIHNKNYTLASFFKRVDELKDNNKIKSLYERISNCYPFTEDKYRVYCQEMKYLCNYIENPDLLYSDNTGNNASTSTTTANSLQSNYDFIEYKGTNGIFYTLSNETEVINSNILLNNIQAKFIKKFAYTPYTDEIKRLFSLLVVEVDLEASRISIDCYSKQKTNYIFNIEVSTYEFSFITVPKDDALYYARIISAVCNKIFSSYEHKPSITYSGSSKKVTTKSNIKEKVTVIKYSEPKPSNKVGQSKRSYDISSSKEIHYRCGHWHYYWYGHRNSPDRYKKLKWVNETIVNRNADSIIIQL